VERGKGKLTTSFRKRRRGETEEEGREGKASKKP